MALWKPTLLAILLIFAVAMALNDHDFFDWNDVAIGGGIHHEGLFLLALVAALLVLIWPTQK